MNISLNQLEEAYKKAVDEKKESFVIDNQELVTNYAKYLIEYLKSKTKNTWQSTK